jgi:hypothetical protein
MWATVHVFAFSGLRVNTDEIHRTGFINLFQAKSMHPSGAKAPFFPALDGMAKAMPLQSTIYEQMPATIPT